MGDGVQQVYPADLRQAARKVRELATQFAKDRSTFKAGMKNYSMDTIDKVTAERGKRIRGEDYDKSIAEKDGQQHSGATSDWLNPFGRFTEADRLQSHVDDVHLSALKDGKSLTSALQRLSGALDAAADLYEQNEGKNSALSKKMMQQLLTATSSTKA
ncbi:hypothetical protein AB0I55_24935 [Actinocatenispora sera]|uniref:hypothetical protein n=1 Tax=Actinocatenispora sera TaxID=390989 RepID=UPI0033DF93EC